MTQSTVKIRNWSLEQKILSPDTSDTNS